MEENNNKKFVYTRNTSIHLRFFGFLLILIMFAAIPLVVLMSTGRAINNSHAAPSATIFVTSTVKSIPVGKKIPVAVILDPGTNLISVVKLTLTYDSTKISTSSGFVLNTASFPVALTTPVYTCNGTLCHISLTASIGSNPTRVIQNRTTLGTIEFVSIAPADQTNIDVDSGTQVLSTNVANQPNENVLSTTSPLTLSIAPITPTPMACGGFIANPPKCPSGYYCDHTGITPDLPGKCIPLSPTPQITCIPRPPCLDSTPRCLPPEPAGGWCPISPTPSTPTPTNMVSNEYASISIISPGVRNQQLTHPTRSVTINLYNITTKQNYTALDTVTFNGTNSFTNNHFNLGMIPAGTYQLLLTMPQHLKKLLTQTDNTNVFSLQPGNTIVIPSVQLIIGDIAPVPGTDNQPFGDNILDVSDYNMLISCYGDEKPTKCTDIGRLAADLNDDGKVDAIDYNILLRSFATRQGDTTPLTNIDSVTPSLTPTPIVYNVTPYPSPTCIVRPWCLDHAPYCTIAEPASGWCPSTSPTVTPILIPTDTPTPTQ